MTKDDVLLCLTATEDYYREHGLNKDADEISEVCDYIEQLQPKKGHWIVLDNCSNSGIYCSECQAKIFDFTHKPKDKISQFCPHCGAKMAPFKTSAE